MSNLSHCLEMARGKKQAVEPETPPPSENPAKISHLQKLLVKAEHGKEFKFAKVPLSPPSPTYNRTSTK